MTKERERRKLRKPQNWKDLTREDRRAADWAGFVQPHPGRSDSGPSTAELVSHDTECIRNTDQTERATLQANLNTTIGLPTSWYDDYLEEKHFGDTYTGAWARTRRKVRTTIDPWIDSYCPTFLTKPATYVLDTLLGPRDIDHTTLRALVSKHQLQYGASSFAKPSEKLYEALSLASRSQSAIDEYIKHLPPEALSDLERAATCTPVQGSIRRRIKQRVVARLGRPVQWEEVGTVGDHIKSMADTWISGQNSYRNLTTAASKIDAIRQTLELFETGRLPAGIMTDPYKDWHNWIAPGRTKGILADTRAQAREDDRLEWERSYLTGLPLSAYSLVKSGKRWISDTATQYSSSLLQSLKSG